MQARNLLEEDCEKLEETMKEIIKTNPAATHNFFREPSPKIQEEVSINRIDKLEDKIDALHDKLDKIFGTAVLINGAWITL